MSRQNVVFHQTMEQAEAAKLLDKLYKEGIISGGSTVMYPEAEVSQVLIQGFLSRKASLFLVDIDPDGFLIRMLRGVVGGPLFFIVSAESIKTYRRSMRKLRYQDMKILIFDFSNDGASAISSREQFLEGGAAEVVLLEPNQLRVEVFSTFEQYNLVLILGQPTSAWQAMFDAQRAGLG